METKNILISVVLTAIIMVSFHTFYEAPRQAALRQQHAIALEEKAQQEKTKASEPQGVSQGKATLDKTNNAAIIEDRAVVIARTKRLPLETNELSGSINLVGGRIDDLLLINYKTTADDNAPAVTLLSPAGSAEPEAYYAEAGWLGENINVPTSTTLWKADIAKLNDSKAAHLTWDNGQGLVFERTIALDDSFMFTITDKIKNTGSTAVTLYPYGLLSRHGHPVTENTTILHEGPMAVVNGTLTERKYTDVISKKTETLEESVGGWLGMTDKYWLVALVPQQNEKLEISFTYDASTEKKPEQGLYQTDFRGNAQTVEAGGNLEHTVRLFAGAKRVRLLDTYANRFDIPHFDRAIDFGWFYFLTKPFLYLLDIMGTAFGSLGLAIMAFTIMLKLLTLPLSIKSYRSMARLKEIQPEMQKMQEKYKDDKQRLSLETVEFYKREKVNPMSGCAPMIIQIPIFFALYKVLYVCIEMRHAPFYGWIHDMSAPDPTSVLTLFGALPFEWPLIPHLGVWPLLMGLSMFLQQKLSPQPADKSQARMFLLMPVIFTFMLAQMSAGLVIYWTWSNLLGLLQQWYMMRQHGPKKAK